MGVMVVRAGLCVFDEGPHAYAPARDAGGERASCPLSRVIPRSVGMLSLARCSSRSLLGG